MTYRVALVSCGKLKLSVSAPAKDLYTSTLFKKTRAYVEPRYDQWLILSAKHQVLNPDEIVAPYEHRMSGRREVQSLWGYQAAEKVCALVPSRSHIDYFAGDDYSYIVGNLINLGFTVDLPLFGMQIGQRLNWLTERLNADNQTLGDAYARWGVRVSPCAVAAASQKSTQSR